MKSAKHAAMMMALAVMAGSAVDAAIIPVNFSGTYTQNFDSLGSTGTSLSSLPEWTVYALSGSHDTFSYASTGLVTTTFCLGVRLRL